MSKNKVQKKKFRYGKKLQSFLQRTSDGQGTALPVQAREEPGASGKAVIFKSEMDFISRCILDYPSIETGGQLFGFYTEAGIPVVLYAIGPGRNANHQVAFFNQSNGTAGLGFR